MKLLGRGEYAVETPGQRATEHFGLAVRDYTHSTAPNRRFPDLLTQRLVKAALADQPPPYAAGELAALAQHCTVAEDAAAKVERQVRKSAAALLLRARIGETFEAFVTGASAEGDLGPAAAPARRGAGRARVRGARRRRSRDGQARAHRRRARVHRLLAARVTRMTTEASPSTDDAADPVVAYRDEDFLDSDDARPLRILVGVPGAAARAPRAAGPGHRSSSSARRASVPTGRSAATTTRRASWRARSPPGR